MKIIPKDIVAQELKIKLLVICLLTLPHSTMWFLSIATSDGKCHRHLLVPSVSLPASSALLTTSASFLLGNFKEYFLGTSQLILPSYVYLPALTIISVNVRFANLNFL